MADTFKFRNFNISQDNCAMKVGTDGVLIGAWANGGERILDIGCGTGLIALMMAQRYPQSKVEGVEIDGNAARQAVYNSNYSTFKDRITIYNSPIQTFVPSAPYDCIVTNPPFFSNSLISPNKARTAARHTKALSFADIFSFAREWLTENGELSAILPKNEIEDFSSEAIMRGFFIARLFDVRTKSNKPIKRCLISFTKKRRNLFEKSEVTLLDDNGLRSKWFNNLTKDFYL